MALVAGSRAALICFDGAVVQVPLMPHDPVCASAKPHATGLRVMSPAIAAGLLVVVCFTRSIL